MRIVHLATISTGMIIIIGIVLVFPAFLRTRADSVGQPTAVILAFVIPDIGNDNHTSQWCKDLGRALEERRIDAIVFETGHTAENNPECVSSFSSNVDIGSQTYSGSNLTRVTDYDRALEEVKNGKRLVDNVGGIDSRVFRASYGTDDNIYSLLNRSGILVDFSYQDHYNKYEQGLFIRYPLRTLQWETHSSEIKEILRTSDHSIPVMIIFDKTAEIKKITEAIDDLRTNENSLKIRFTNGSDISGLELTQRKVANS